MRRFAILSSALVILGVIAVVCARGSERADPHEASRLDGPGSDYTNPAKVENPLTRRPEPDSGESMRNRDNVSQAHWAGASRALDTRRATDPTSGSEISYRASILRHLPERQAWEARKWEAAIVELRLTEEEADALRGILSAKHVREKDLHNSFPEDLDPYDPSRALGEHAIEVKLRKELAETLGEMRAKVFRELTNSSVKH